MKVLVLGSKGFIGSNILMQANCHRVDVVGLSRIDCDFLETRKLAAIISRESPDYVINATGLVAGIQGNIDKPFDLLNTNAQLTLSIANSCLIANVEKYISYSAACIYPGNLLESLNPSDIWSDKPEATSLSYATSKIMSLQLSESINSQYGLRWKTIIPSNLYGFKENLSDIDNSAHVLESLIAKTLYAKRNHKLGVEVWGDGSPLRTFLNIKDLASATFHILGISEQLPSIINVNGGEEVSIKSLAESIVHFTGFTGDLWFNSTKPNGSARKNLDDSILRSTGWAPKTHFLAELRALIFQVEASL